MLFVLPKGALNLAGKPFDELTPQSIARVTPAEGVVWLCLCKCGQTREVAAKNLTSGRITRCLPCANQRRAVQVQAAYRQALDRHSLRGHHHSDAQRRWETHLEQLTKEQRAVYDDFIARRERLGMKITDRVRAGAVEAAMTVGIVEGYALPRAA